MDDSAFTPCKMNSTGDLFLNSHKYYKEGRYVLGKVGIRNLSRTCVVHHPSILFPGKKQSESIWYSLQVRKPCNSYSHSKRVNMQSVPVPPVLEKSTAYPHLFLSTQITISRAGHISPKRPRTSLTPPVSDQE